MTFRLFADRDGAQAISQSLPAALLPAVTYLTILILGLLFGYYFIFTNELYIDDEGTIILLVDYFIRSGGNFDAVGEYQYHGPFFFLVKYLIHFLTNTDISHNTNRLTTLAFWALTPIISAFFVHRLTRSLLLAAMVQLQLIFLLLALMFAAGHPQELSLVLIATALLVSSFVGARPLSIWPVAAMAAIVGALLLVKINIGVYLGAALALSLLRFLPPGKLVTAIFALAACAAVLLPVAVMGKLAWQNPLDRNYCAQVTLVVIACLVASRKNWQGAGLRWADVGWAVCTVLCTVAFICGVVIAMGSSLGGIANTVLLRALQLSASIKDHVPVKYSDVSVAAAAVLLAVGYRITATKMETSQRWLWALAALKLLYGIAALYSMYSPVRIELPFEALSFIWLALLPPCSPSPDTLKARFPRVFLCFAAAFQALQAFPVAGAQLYWSVILIAPLAAICIADGFSFIRMAIGRRWPSAEATVSRPGAGWVIQAILITCLVFWFWQKMDIGQLRDKYLSQPSLDLDGADRIHLPKESTDTLLALVGNLRDQCDGFVGIPGMPSLYYWSGIQSPGVITDYWMLNMDVVLQNRIIESMEKYERPCVVYDPGRLNTWVRDNTDISKEIPHMPLMKYIKAHYAKAGRIGSYRILHKKVTSPVARAGAAPIH